MNRRDFIKTGAVAMAGAMSGVQLAFASRGGDDSKWWTDQAVRWLQTNLREPDAALDPVSFVDEIAELDVNVSLINAGGITAYYPTDIEFAHVSAHMPKGQDTFGEILVEAHARDIHVISRWDFSKARKEVYDAHPDWFFTKDDGSPAIYNGVYQVCINGGWIQQKSLEILGEALDRYDVDGCFFNNFLNPTRDYAGTYLGICHCDNCQRLYNEKYGRALPKDPDADYRVFMRECGQTFSEKIIGLMRSKRPSAALVGGTPKLTDIVYGESSTGLDRPLPLWPYTASDNVNKWRNSYPGTGVMCQAMQFLDFAWRFSSVPRAEISTRIWQSVANGGFAALSLNGTLGDLKNRSAVATAKPIYQWLKEHQQYYHGQLNEARVVLLATAQGGQSGAGFEGSTEAYRGMFRLLTEQHIPFASMTHLDWIGQRDVDLVITTGPVPKALEDYVKNGGNLIVASNWTPEFEIAPIVKRWEDPDGAYFKIHDKVLFSSLEDIDVAMMNGDYLEVEGEGKPALTFVPPALYAPPEFVGLGWEDSGKPGMVMKQLGRGSIAWLPWDIAGLYHRHSQESHQRILVDLVDRMLPGGRDLRSNAHPSVAISVMRQHQRQLVHLVNLSGHSDTAYHEPLPINDTVVELKGSFSKAYAVRAKETLKVTRKGDFSLVELPYMEEYELIELS
jgi:hypothetical protein